MNKTLLCCCLFWGIAGLSSAQLFKPKTDKKPKLTTAVAMSAAAQMPNKKAESWWIYSIADNKVEEHNLKIADIRYNKAGELAEWHVYDMSGELDFIYSYQYETQPKRVKRLVQYPEAAPILDLVETYNAQNELVKTERYGQNGELIETNVWEFDNQARLRKSSKYNGKNALIYQVDYEWNGKSRKESHHNLQANEQHEVAAIFNPDNQLMQETHYKSTGELLRKTTFAYDEKKRLVEKRFYHNGKEVDVVEKYIYSSINDEVAHSIYTAGGSELSEYTVYKYEYE